jgi:hypothetical protein
MSRRTVAQTLQEWRAYHSRIDLVLGQDYLRGIDPNLFSLRTLPLEVITGPIGMKLNCLRQMRHTMGAYRKTAL